MSRYTPPKPTAAEMAAMDNFLKPSALAIQAIVDGVDEVAASMERTWGVGRLRLLVGDLLRAKFDAQAGKFDAAVDAGLEVDVLKHGEAMKRAWQALDKAAREAGHKPQPPTVWEVVGPTTGQVFALVRTSADASMIQQPNSIGSVWTLDDIAVVLEALPPAAHGIKTLWPEAVVKRVAEPDWNRGDEIPF